ncbi:uncharacterized protein LOC124493507 [Dermatophagoides farinae]|uniref:28S ribosomal protein S36, mitochondrial n=1 Tax=Dermatophagoides farinae TaxID=6954 RepID=A0A922HRP8_DERFA|nr:28S ribosomal protein S36, mitochondrial-like [Dermatophagoides farinae]KAH7643576.1 hypothetical protein HUG17_5938 [Dermatophagoides farinae]KAH9506433.1 hypothetical protein DERF_011166 [Dermatophagoides farinae]
MSTVAKAWKVIKPHVPLIHFKKGGHPTNQTHGSMAAVSATTTTTTTKTTTTTMSLMDDTQLPARFQRKPISELEMQLIETGGVPL